VCDKATEGQRFVECKHQLLVFSPLTPSLSSLPSLPQPLALDVHSLHAQKFEIERLLAETENRLQHL